MSDEANGVLQIISSLKFSFIVVYADIRPLEHVKPTRSVVVTQYNCTNTNITWKPQTIQLSYIRVANNSDEFLCVFVFCDVRARDRIQLLTHQRIDEFEELTVPSIKTTVHRATPGKPSGDVGEDYDNPSRTISLYIKHL